MSDESVGGPIPVETRVTGRDVPLLNRGHIQGLATTARRIGTALLFAGLFGILGWLWLVWRSIDELRDSESDGFSSGAPIFGVDGDVSAADYADVIAQSLSYLMFATVVVGVAVVVRVLAAHVGNAVGVNVSDLAIDDDTDDTDGDGNEAFRA